MKKSKARKITELSFLIVFVFGFRLLIEEAIPMFEQNLNLSFMKFVGRLLSNIPVTVTIVVLNIVSLYTLNKFEKKESLFLKTLYILLIALVVALFAAILIRYPVWNKGLSSKFFSDIYFRLTLLTAFVFNLLLISVIQVYLYYIKSHERELNVEIGKKNRAQYQYQQLKRQLNPHFLFNSLNVLDYLIQTNPDKASDFVRKLSSVYRYLLSIEENSTVSIKEELEFVSLYFDLLKERFSDGLELTVDIDKESSDSMIIPGGLQLLVENAVKHNIVSLETPLKIEIYARDGYITISNNLQPKINSLDRGGFGLNNIKGQYNLLFKRDITIESDDLTFKVSLPLIER